MELVKRYVAAVQRELPEDKRQEIGRELNANILDRLDALEVQQGQLSDEDTAAVLKQMGHPQAVAYQFVPPKSLVAAEDMPLLKHVLFMVLGLLFVLRVVGSTVDWVGSSDANLIRFVLQITLGFLDSAIFAFAVIVLIFAAVNFNGGRMSGADAKDWEPQDLPKTDLGWQHISLTDIFIDLATGTFLLVVIWHPLWMSPEQITERSVTFTEHALQLLQWFSPVILLSVLLSLWQLRQRIWNRSLLLSAVLINTAFAVFLITLALSGPLLQGGPVELKSVVTVLQLNRGFLYGLLIMASIPAYEAVRDLLRLRKLA